MSFQRLHLQVESARILDEINQFPESQWLISPTEEYMNGGILPLVTVGGQLENPGLRGPMGSTPYLDRCRNLRCLLAVMKSPLGRTFIQRSLPEQTKYLSESVDYYRKDRMRILVFFSVPAAACLQSSETSIPINEGDVWLINAGQPYHLSSPAGLICLVLDTVGSSALRQLTEITSAPVYAYPPTDPPLAFERINFPVVMSPWELEHCVAGIMFALPCDSDSKARDEVIALCETLHQDWSAVWACFGDTDDGLPAYRSLLKRFTAELLPHEGRLAHHNGTDTVALLREIIVDAALNTELRPPTPPPIEQTPIEQKRVSRRSTSDSRFDRPVFIVSAPRTGSSLLFETLSRAADVWTLGGEGHAEFEGIPELHPINRNWHSNRVTAEDATAAVIEQLKSTLTRRLRNRNRERLPNDASRFRLLEKTPKNSLRVPFLAKAFPDARFIYLYREPRGNISSIIEAWRSRRFVTYPSLPGWHTDPWSLLLIPDWRRLIHAPLEEIAAAQWKTVNTILLDDLTELSAERWCAVDYEQFLADPQAVTEALARFAGFDWDTHLEEELPLSRHSLTPPSKDKWRTHATLLERLTATVEPVALRCRATLSKHGIPT